MRKGQKFSPQKIRKWVKNGRGTGVFDDYQPFHQITRDDPASKGRSQLCNWARTSRLHHYLSDHESNAFGFITMLANVIDIREQYALSLEEHIVDLASYSASHLHLTSEGTLAIAARLGVKHPQVTKAGEKEPWRLTTDLLVAIENSPKERKLLAISVKPDDYISPRKRKLLMIEKLYWEMQGVEWLLITPSLSKHSVRMTVRRNMAWGVPKVKADIASSRWIEHCCLLTRIFHGKPFCECIKIIEEDLHINSQAALLTFWQSVWKGKLTIDLDRPSWPRSPICLIDQEEFTNQNPISARRSLCL